MLVVAKERRTAGSRSRLGSGSEPLVAMMKTADLWERDDPALARRLDGTRFRTIFPERQMSSESMVIRQVRRQETPQVMLIQNDRVLQAFTADRSDNALGVCVLPR